MNDETQIEVEPSGILESQWGGSCNSPP